MARPIEGSKSSLEKLLSIFTEVKAGEAKRALLMTINIFLILTSYLIAKVVREPLILSGGGAELKSYASAIQVVLLLGVVQVFGWLAATFPRRKLINFVTLFFIGSFITFYLVLVIVGPWNGIVYFLWVGIFSLVVIAQFWSFANDIYTPEEGKRLFVLLAFGASAGGVFGPMLAGLILGLVGVYNLLLVSAGVLLISLVLTNFIISRVESDPKTDATDIPPKEEPPMSKEGAMKLVFRNKYLLMIALLILISNFVNTTGEYILGRGVEEAAAELAAAPGAAADADKVFIGGFYADFYTIVGFVGLLMQLLIVSRILKYFGVRFAIMALPIIALGTYLSIALFPIILVIRWGKTAENATDYSLNNTVRQILFLPTTREEKYKAKVAIDSFFVRAGDVLSAGLVFVGVTWLAFSVRHFALICIVLAVIWLVIAFMIGIENKKLLARGVKSAESR
jgi:AAA family ATP:ADP antiporter